MVGFSNQEGKVGRGSEVEATKDQEVRKRKNECVYVDNSNPFRENPVSVCTL